MLLFGAVDDMCSSDFLISCLIADLCRSSLQNIVIVVGQTRDLGRLLVQPVDDPRALRRVPSLALEDAAA